MFFVPRRSWSPQEGVPATEAPAGGSISSVESSDLLCGLPASSRLPIEERIFGACAKLRQGGEPVRLACIGGHKNTLEDMLSICQKPFVFFSAVQTQDTVTSGLIETALAGLQDHEVLIAYCSIHQRTTSRADPFALVIRNLRDFTLLGEMHVWLVARANFEKVTPSLFPGDLLKPK